MMMMMMMMMMMKTSVEEVKKLLTLPVEVNKVAYEARQPAALVDQPHDT